MEVGRVCIHTGPLHSTGTWKYTFWGYEGHKPSTSGSGALCGVAGEEEVRTKYSGNGNATFIRAFLSIFYKVIS